MKTIRVQKFEDALEKLKAKMLLLGYTDYADVCGELDMYSSVELYYKFNDERKKLL